MQIAFVDEDPDQRKTYGLLLQECFSKDEMAPKVVGYEPTPEMPDMNFLVTTKDIVTVILDEQLKESGIAKYLGIELASYLRSLNKKIPIYILTSYPESDELINNEISVEDILNKQDLPARKLIEGARILRRIDNFLDISTDREKRFEQLLRGSINGEIDEKEKQEFIELGYLRSTPFETEEIFSQEKLETLNKLEDDIKLIEKNLS
ncbi:MAG: hypothetical protein ACXW1P_01000 [Methylophilaceae bacterium]